MGLINLGAGLSEMGQSVANTAGEMGLQQQKQALETQQMELQSQLQAGREHAARVETGAPEQVAAAKLALVPQILSTDAYLKATGHPNGVADYGIQAPGAGPAPGQDGSAQASSDANSQAQGNAQQSPQGGNGPSASGQDAPSAGQSSGSSAPPVSPVGDKGKIIGMALPPGWTPAMAAIAGPEGLAAAWAKFSGPQEHRSGSVTTVYDFNTGQDRVLNQNPNAPLGSLYDPETKSFVQIGNAGQAIASAKYDEARGTSQGSLPADLTKIGAAGSQARETAGFQKGLDVGTNLIDTYSNGTAYKVPQSLVLDVAKGVPGAAERYSALTTPGNPATAAAAGTGAAIPGLQKDGSLKSSVGSIGYTIPPAPAPPASSALQSGPSAVQAANQASYAPTIKGWFDSVQPAARTEQMGLAMGQALKDFQSGAWAAKKQDIAKQLIASGVMDAKTAQQFTGMDASAAEILAKNNFGASLNSLKAGGVTRFTQSEIFAQAANLANSKLEPAANLAILGQLVGTAQQTKAIADGWTKAPTVGYSSPLDYETNFYNANPLQTFINNAEKQIGPLKGMPGPTQTNAGTSAAPKTIKFSDLPTGP